MVLALLRPQGIGIVPVGLQNSLAAIVESAPCAMALLDDGFRHLGASDRYCARLRADRIAVLGKTHQELFSSLPKEWELAQKRCLAGKSSSFEQEWTLCTIGKQRRMSWQLYPWRKFRSRMGGAILFLHELTADESAEQEALSEFTRAGTDLREQKPDLPEAEAFDVQLQHARKIESVCCLAKRIAHDLNNMLLVINGYSSMLTEDLAANHQLEEKARAISRAGERAAHLVDELHSLARI
jgi:signal transduction histidine kinase